MHYVIMHYSPYELNYELMMSKWNILPASKSDWKTQTSQRGVLDHDYIMFQSSVAVVFFVF